MIEVWKDIEGFSGKYSISTMGRVMSYGKIISGTIEKRTGYRVVNLRNGRPLRRLMYVHRIVAQAFIPNPENKPQVNHINFVRTDNTVNNIEWTTVSENIRHSFKAGHHVNRIKIQSKPIVQLTKEDIPVKEWPSIKSAATALNIHHGGISSVVNGKQKSYKGFKWRFLKKVS